jgi:peroxygenase
VISKRRSNAERGSAFSVEELAVARNSRRARRILTHMTKTKLRGVGSGGVIAALVVALAGCMTEAPGDEVAVDDDEAALLGLTWLEGITRQPPAIPWEEMTALQRHVAFFDWNGDGFITVLEDYRGLRALGIDPVLASGFATAINGALATPSRGFPSLTIDLRRIATGIHGSDSGIYDDDGNFVPEAFERLFREWDLDGTGGLDPGELVARAVEDADLFDVFGVVASGAEFGLLFVVAAEDGELSRARMRSFYDGTLFYVLAEEREGAPPWSWWWD